MPISTSKVAAWAQIPRMWTSDVVKGFESSWKNADSQPKNEPRLVPRGSRGAAFDAFKTAHRTSAAGSFVALWIDSEEPLEDLEATWQHLQTRDQWVQPVGSSDEQVLFMTTCMETWFVADRAALQGHFKDKLQVSALPPLHDLESRHRHDVQGRL